MVALGFGLVAPALPLFAREFGVGRAAAGAVVSAFALMRLVMAPFVGRLVNAFGERVLLAAGIGVVAVSSALAARQSDRSEPLALSVALRNRAYLAALAAAFAGDFALVGARSAMVPLYVRDALHLSAGWAYAAFLIVSVVSGALLLPTGKVADTIGRRPVIVVGLLVGALAFLLLPTLPAIAGLVTATVLIGVSAASDAVAPGAVMGDVVAGKGGTVVAVFQMAGDLGLVLGPLVTGLVADQAGYSPAFVLCAVVCALPIFIVL